MRSRWTTLAVVALLAAYFGLAWTASFSKGVSFDEGLQLATGYDIWLHGDFRREGANGDFIKRWATLPYLISRPAFLATTDATWRTGSGYDLGFRFLFELGNSPESLLRQARAMVALLGAATGLLVFLATRELFGKAAGVAALGLYVFSPSMLAFGGIVSTDMSITFALFGATWLLWRLLHAVSWPRLLASLVFVGIVVLTKLSGLVILPIAAVLVIVRLIGGEPLVLGWRNTSWPIASRRRQLAVFAVLALAHAGVAWGAIWAHYGFRFDARPPGMAALSVSEPVTYDEIPNALAAALEGLRSGRWLPEGFCDGVEVLLGDDDKLGSFMRGEWRIGGRLEFFPYAIWVKTHPALLLLLVLAIIAWWRARRAVWEPTVGFEDRPAPRIPTLYSATPHFVLIGCFLAVAMTEDVNIGHRHVMPIYPSLFVLAGGATLVWWRRSRWMIGLVALLMLWCAGESFAIRPHYLSYFGPQAGGPENGYKSLVDSSLDWGMNLPSLKRWLEHHNPGGRERVYLGYFGTDNPAHYGINCTQLPGFFDRREFKDYRLRAGYYAISATLLQGVYTAAFGPWNQDYERLYRSAQKKVFELRRFAASPAGRKAMAQLNPTTRLDYAKHVDLYDNLRFARLCSWLRNQGPPPRQVGHSILIWKLGRAEIDAAVYGPPVELATSPETVNVRRLRRPEFAGP